MAKACMKCGAEGADDRETCGSCGSEYEVSSEVQTPNEGTAGTTPEANPIPNTSVHVHLASVHKSLAQKIEEGFKAMLDRLGDAIGQSKFGGDN